MIFVILPYFSCLFVNTFLNEEDFDELIYFYCLTFYFLLLYSCFYFVVYQIEKNFQHPDNVKGNFTFLVHVILIILFLSLIFSSYYWCIYNYNNLNFLNVDESYVFLDFLFYSFGVFIMNNSSDIQANTMYAKLFVGTEMFTAFICLILILSNFKDFKAKT